MSAIKWVLLQYAEYHLEGFHPTHLSPRFFVSFVSIGVFICSGFRESCIYSLLLQLHPHCLYKVAHNTNFHPHDTNTDPPLSAITSQAMSFSNLPEMVMRCSLMLTIDVRIDTLRKEWCVFAFNKLFVENIKAIISDAEDINPFILSKHLLIQVWCSSGKTGTDELSKTCKRHFFAYSASSILHKDGIMKYSPMRIQLPQIKSSCNCNVIFLVWMFFTLYWKLEVWNWNQKFKFPHICYF